MHSRRGAVKGSGMDEARVRRLLDRHEAQALPRLRRLWAYYRNPCASWGGQGRGRLAQESGLPARLRGGASDEDQREVVIENDIGWRIDAMVDFMLGRPVRLLSRARDAAERERIERALALVFEASGGMETLHDAALMGSVYGHVDLVVRVEGGSRRTRDIEDAARRVRISPVSPERGVAALDAYDYRTMHGYIVRALRRREDGRGGIADAALRAVGGGGRSEVIEVFTARERVVREDGHVLVREAHPVGALPVVHIQNRSQPLRYEGMSEVEGLIPLQDELNTRLSDRAHRVTMQSFKMYLAKGLDAFGDAGRAMRVAPGQVWSTDNPDASVEAFGGDASSPSEDAHIEQVRQALDKASSVTPVAAGVIREKLGQLSSENALRITFTGLLAKTARRRLAYGRGLGEAMTLALHALHSLGALETDARDRGVRVAWPDPLPPSERDRLDVAMRKIELGVARETVLAELGYAAGVERE